MKPAPLPQDESARLKSLAEHQLLNTLPEEVYDDITRLASEICGTPTALLTLVDEDRQWFKSKFGFDVGETPREFSFCAHAILNPNEPLVVPDARYDERFHDNPLTTGEPHVVFYAGVPVKGADGQPLGTLCVIDNRPRELTDDKLKSLQALAKLIDVHFKLRKNVLELEESKKRFASVQQLANRIWINVHNIQTTEHLGSEQTFQELQQDVDALQELTKKI